MYVKFKKKHDVGIAKGHCSLTTQKAGEEFISEGYAEEISAEDYEAWKKDWKADQEEKAKEATKTAEKSNAKREKGLSQEIQPEDEEAEETGPTTPEVEYVELTKEDLTTYPELTRDMKEGDKIQVLDGVKTVGANGLFVLEGNSEASSSDGGNESTSSEEESTTGENGPTDTGGEEKTYHAINEEDLKANPELMKGMALGAEVEVDKDNNFVIVEDKLVVKPVEK